MLRLIRSCDDAGEQNEASLLALCLRSLERGGRVDDEPAHSRIIAALRVIEPYERMYQSLSFLFDRLRAAATDRGEANLQSVMQESVVSAACKGLRRASADFLTTYEQTVPDETGLGEARHSLQKAGVVDLARLTASDRPAIDLARDVVQRHLRVQDEKLDGGLPKEPWIKLESGRPDNVRLTSQRFGVNGVTGPETWREAARHPYRTWGAQRFIRMCKIQ